MWGLVIVEDDARRKVELGFRMAQEPDSAMFDEEAVGGRTVSQLLRGNGNGIAERIIAPDGCGVLGGEHGGRDWETERLDGKVTR